MGERMLLRSNDGLWRPSKSSPELGIKSRHIEGQESELEQKSEEIGAQKTQICVLKRKLNECKAERDQLSLAPFASTALQLSQQPNSQPP
eukprot:6208963-Pleurochrysis_carterae.AAC.3